MIKPKAGKVQVYAPWRTFFDEQKDFRCPIKAHPKEMLDHLRFKAIPGLVYHAQTVLREIGYRAE